MPYELQKPLKFIHLFSFLYVVDIGLYGFNKSQPFLYMPRQWILFVKNNSL
jgi:hypothetical protein